MTPDQTANTTLTDHIQPITPHDTLAEAGRKELLRNFVQMLQHEAGSLSGEDMEDVHLMRVATRRMRSIFRLLHDQYKPKISKPFTKQLKTIAKRLGDIRDLDVMIDNLQNYQETQSGDDRAAVDSIIQKLDKKRKKARKRLSKLFESESYRNFIRTFAEFVTSKGKGTLAVQDEFMPHQVRHVAPVILHQHLANVRAYDDYISDAPAEVLHQLRIEFKRLRYAVTFFKGVLGKSIEDFIEELKAMQDHLGRLNDIVVTQDMLSNLKKADETEAAVIQNYLSEIKTEAAKHSADYETIWQNFNTRTVQRRFSDALLVLR